MLSKKEQKPSKLPEMLETNFPFKLILRGLHSFSYRTAASATILKAAAALAAASA